MDQKRIARVGKTKTWASSFQSDKRENEPTISRFTDDCRMKLLEFFVPTCPDKKRNIGRGCWISTDLFVNAHKRKKKECRLIVLSRPMLRYKTKEEQPELTAQFIKSAT
ncbi:hypothetical protein GHT06_009685 [Daphnia sinensis]|uniref:Uncharacterized protein n=1 Tax=Daphnia sinensis TaxID=1820382 RepID=A0AAD5L4K0_9CRUS|nr:hypothetical protein GHT06_009685 [Daphnia sinensis]